MWDDNTFVKIFPEILRRDGWLNLSEHYKIAAYIYLQISYEYFSVKKENQTEKEVDHENCPTIIHLYTYVNIYREFFTLNCVYGCL